MSNTASTTIRTDFLLTTASNGLQIGLGIIGGILLARGLGVAGRGDVAAWRAWTITGVWLLNGSLDESLIYHAAGIPERIGKIVLALKSSRGVSLAITTVLGGVVGALIVNEHRLLALSASALFAAFSVSTFQPLAILRSCQETKRWNLARLSAPVALTALTIGFFVFDALNVVNALVIGALAAFAGWLAASLTSKRVAAGFVADQNVRVNARSLLRYGASINVAILPTALLLRLDQMIMSISVSRAELGNYAVAYTVTSLGTALALTSQQVIFPRLVALPIVANRVSDRFVLLAFGAGTLAAVSLWLTLPLVIRVAFGADFVDAASLGRVLCFGLPFAAGSAVFVAQLKATGRVRALAILEWAAFVPTAIALVVLLPLFGATAAAWITVASYVGLFLLQFVDSRAGR